MATSQASCEAIWLRKFLVGLFGRELSLTVIHCDNQICIKLSENPVFHDRSKHIEIRYHFIIDWVQCGVVQLQYIQNDEQVADIFTNPLPRGKQVIHYFSNFMFHFQSCRFGICVSHSCYWHIIYITHV